MGEKVERTSVIELFAATSTGNNAVQYYYAAGSINVQLHKLVSSLQMRTEGGNRAWRADFRVIRLLQQ